jgi:hypothetical protein
MKQLAMLLAAAFMLSPVGLAIAAVGETPAETPDRGVEASARPDAVESHRQIVVYYFHGTRRCRTCLSIEATAHDLISSRFAAQLQSGEMIWKVVNYDEPENEHFIKDFGLVSSSLVIVEMKEGEPVEYEVLQKAWPLAHDKPGFDYYVEQSVLKHLGSAE